MTYGFLDTLTTLAVRAVQTANGAGGFWEAMNVNLLQDRFTDREADFIAARDSFYLASILETGWLYLASGRLPGFLRVLDERRPGFADFAGNRQYLTLGHVAMKDRVVLFLLDSPLRHRMKILAHMTAHSLSADPELAARLSTPAHRGRPERAFMLTLKAFDWNCSQHITPRFTEAEWHADASR